MAAKKNDVTAVVRQYSRLLRRHLPVRTVFLYGSHAAGNARQESDIDVGVVIRGSNRKCRLAVTAVLYRLARQVDVRIEPRCIFQDEYENPKSASILEAIIRSSREVSL